MKEIYDLAEQYHNDGNNCVESVVKACNEGLQLGLPDVARRFSALQQEVPKCLVKRSWNSCVYL